MKKYAIPPIVSVLLLLCSTWSASAEDSNFNRIIINNQKMGSYMETNSPSLTASFLENSSKARGCGIGSPLTREESTFYSTALLWCVYPFTEIKHEVVIQRKVMNFWVTVATKSNSALATNKLETAVSYRCDLGPGPHDIRVSARMDLTMYDGKKGSIEVEDYLSNQACDW